MDFNNSLDVNYQLIDGKGFQAWLLIAPGDKDNPLMILKHFKS